jgi:DNA-binding PadR family transcriptional regulator
MDTGSSGVAAAVASRFGLAPPRRFLLPAILLLLSESPSHGYRLEKGLHGLGLGRVDRPGVYRGLAQLEADGLVEWWYEPARGRRERRVFGLTPLGERVLAAWMGVVKQERDALDAVLRRYQATGRPDALLAGVAGGWAALTASGWSPVSPVVPVRHDPSREPGVTGEGPAGGDGPRGGWLRGGEVVMTTFSVVPDRSVLLIEVRSTVGPISFGVMGLTGWARAGVRAGALAFDVPPSAHLEVAVDGLRSGNGLYDAELLRRIEARRFPRAHVDLRACAPLGGGHVMLEGELTFHGVTRPVEGTVSAGLRPDGVLVASGEQVFDIRDFGLVSPTVLMLRIFPDVRVRLHVEAAPKVPEV